MIKQPAKINYFFKGGYVELREVIKNSFKNCKRKIKDAWNGFLHAGSEMIDAGADFIDAFIDIVTFNEPMLEDLFPFWRYLIKTVFNFFRVIFISFFTFTVCCFLSIVHITILLSIFILVYLAFILLKFFDWAYCTIKGISSNCPNCQIRFRLPVYTCSSCGKKHTKLIPSKYGIFKRECECGNKIPTTFLNGRQRQIAICPNCNFHISDGGKHYDICIPVVGGPSCGKTCFISMSMSYLANKSMKEYHLTYKYASNGLDDFDSNINALNRGYLPEKTFDMRLKYYQFYLNPRRKIKHLISLCDVGGEVYQDKESIGQQIGYRYANAFLVIIDPLSIEMYRKEVAKTLDIDKYNPSVQPIDEILSMLTVTLENMYAIKKNKVFKAMKNTNIAVVFTKLDIPGLEKKIGEQAIKEYIAQNPKANRLEALNAICGQFLIDYEEENFLNQLRSKFKSIQFFSCSSLGHIANGTAFTPVKVEDPILWMADRCSKYINLKDKLGKIERGME